jgi:hypothetical protein
MRQYTAKVDCFGYQGRYWRAGTTVMVNDSDPRPPAHFVPTAEVKEIEPEAVADDGELEDVPVGVPNAENVEPSPLARVRRKGVRNK